MTDTILNFQINKLGIRGRVVRLSEVLDSVIGQHDYPEWVGFVLSEGLLLNTAMASSIKLSGILSLQAHSKGAIKLLATDYFAPEGENENPKVRGYVRVNQEARESGLPNFDTGFFGVIIDQKNGTQPYQGMTALQDNLILSAEEYFRASEQIPTKFLMRVHYDVLKNKWRGGLMMIQHLANEGGHSQSQASEFAMQHASVLMETMGEEELLDFAVSSPELVYRLFHEDDPTTNAERQIEFGCPCSEDRVRNSLSIYSQKEIQHMIDSDGKVTADCQFCGAHYKLDPTSVGLEAK